MTREPLGASVAAFVLLYDTSAGESVWLGFTQTQKLAARSRGAEPFTSFDEGALTAPNYEKPSAADFALPSLVGRAGSHTLGTNAHCLPHWTVDTCNTPVSVIDRFEGPAGPHDHRRPRPGGGQHTQASGANLIWPAQPLRTG